MNRDKNISIVGKCGDSQTPSELNKTAWADSELYSTQLANLLFSCLGVGRAWSAAGFGATGAATRDSCCAVHSANNQASVMPHA